MFWETFDFSSPLLREYTCIFEALPPYRSVRRILLPSFPDTLEEDFAVDISRYTEEIERLDSLRRKFESERDELKRMVPFVGRFRTLLRSPMYSLPPELLLSIFRYCHPTSWSRSTDISSLRTFIFPINVSQVCRWWRGVVLDKCAQDLWGNIWLDISEGPLRYRPFPGLSYDHTLPSIPNDKWDCTYEEMYFLYEHEESDEQRLADVLQLYLRRSGRALLSLDAKGETPIQYQQLRETFQDCCCCTQDLSFDMPSDCLPGNSPKSTTSLIHHTQTLMIVGQSGILFNSFAHLFPSISTLTIGARTTISAGLVFPSVTSLSLTLEHENEDFRSFFRACPNIIHLEVTFDCDGSPYLPAVSPDPPVTLSSLRNLVLDAGTSPGLVPVVLRYITCPGLKTLMISYLDEVCAWDNGEYGAAALCHMLDRSSCHLEEMIFLNLTVSSSDLLSLLDSPGCRLLHSFSAHVFPQDDDHLNLNGFLEILSQGYLPDIRRLTVMNSDRIEEDTISAISDLLQLRGKTLESFTLDLDVGRTNSDSLSCWKRCLAALQSSRTITGLEIRTIVHQNCKFAYLGVLLDGLT